MNSTRRRWAWASRCTRILRRTATTGLLPEQEELTPAPSSPPLKEEPPERAKPRRPPRLDWRRCALSEAGTLQGGVPVRAVHLSSSFSGQLWLVVRDNRGAHAFQQFRFFVCDDALPTPTRCR